MLGLKSDETVCADYEQDLVLWYQHQIELLREHRFEQLDVKHLIEELHSAMSKERRELASRLGVLLMHLLKCQFQPLRIARSWLGTLDVQRSEIARLLEDSPSLVHAVIPMANKEYPLAVRHATRETRLPKAVFPATNPYSKDQLLDLDFLP